jgi:hypothetical protein
MSEQGRSLQRRRCETVGSTPTGGIQRTARLRLKLA